MTIPAGRLQIQGELDARKTQIERNILGQFATPPSLARQIISATLPFLSEDEPIRFLEPALGTGSFFEALHEVAKHNLDSALGVEVDPGFAKASQAIWAGYPLKVVEADFTALDPSSVGFTANLLVTNPPYVRHHHIPTEKKQRLVRLSKRISGIQPSGLAGLYVHFMLTAHRWLAPGAVCTWLIPSEFMDVNYGTELKRYLTEKVQLLLIHRFEPKDLQFDDALVTSTVVIFRNAVPRPDSLVSFSYGGNMREPREVSGITVADLRSLRKWSSLSGSGYSREQPDLTLGDAFTIRRGIATGDNKFFVRSIREFQSLGVPPEFLKPILPPPRNVRKLVVEAGEDGFPLLDENLALFDCSLSEHELERSFPLVFALVLAGKEAKVDQKYLCKGRSPWYSQERRVPAPLLCTYMGRPKVGEPPFRIIRNKSRAIATNVYLLLYPKPWLSRADKDGQLLARVCEHLWLLRSSDYTTEGRVYGGGLHKMEPRELARLPLSLAELNTIDRGAVQDTLF
jgi:predicted RNA methylase